MDYFSERASWRQGNSGKSFTSPVKNSFVVSTETHEQKEALFYLSFMLLETKCYRFYLSGMIASFIYIADVKNVLEKYSRYFGADDFKTKRTALKKVEFLEVNLQSRLNAIQELKSVLIRDLR
ncbi:hypothetical protein [uncultured Polaribacter sp.]|uniref:DUF6943 family protein n=1 Tax=uncultured Polaribacter sp. TaxID=174711 RepID=UPI00262A65A5|nr:hypothetical protein [uncultured Polaribacter sp.]